MYIHIKRLFPPMRVINKKYQPYEPFEVANSKCLDFMDLWTCGLQESRSF